VPVSALRHGAPGDFVFVVQPDKTVKLVVVKPGPSDGARTAVLSGLAKGQTVVSEGADGLDDGSAVRLPGDKGGQGGGAGGGGKGSGKGKHKAAQ
jgi:multidrug efflux system membrane fusion protein